jgi:hypothetical protein
MRERALRRIEEKRASENTEQVYQAYLGAMYRMALRHAARVTDREEVREYLNRLVEASEREWMPLSRKKGET